MATTTSSPPRPRPRRIRWRRHRYPDQFIDRRQELLIGLLFSLLGLFATALVFMSADSLMCAFGEWDLECSQLTPPRDE